MKSIRSKKKETKEKITTYFNYRYHFFSLFRPSLGTLMRKIFHSSCFKDFNSVFDTLIVNFIIDCWFREDAFKMRKKKKKGSTKNKKPFRKK